MSSLLSVIIPCLNEERNLSEVYSRVKVALRAFAEFEWEIIFIDDGSTDRTAEVALKLHAEDPQVKLLQFSRNFGHQAALSAGMDHARGDAVIVMDADLQHPVEIIPLMIQQWQKGAEIVYTVRTDGQGIGWVKKLSSRWFYSIFRLLTQLDMPANVADFRLMDRKVVDALGQLSERTRFLRGLTYWVGFRSVGIPYMANNRFSGVTKYSMKKMTRLALDGIVSFSTIPLHFAIYLGVLTAAFGFVYSIDVLYTRIILNIAIEGWTSLMMVLTILGGTILLFLGVLGVYLGKIYEEVKHRPIYILRDRVGIKEKGGK